MSAITIALYADDTFPITLTYKEKTGPVDITNHSFSLKIAYDATNGGPLAIAGAPLDQTDTDNLGKFELTPQAGDLKEGTWDIEIMVTYPDNTERTFPQGAIFIKPRIM